ncbi:MAG TPA: hypothetical protein VF216_09480 [Mizugakiibacter sp.]
MRASSPVPATHIEFQGQSLLRLGDDDHFILVAPRHGGRLLRWVRRGRELLYWPHDADWSRAAKIRGGNPLLFPFIGRHFVDGEPGAWRDADGRRYALPAHGFARERPFSAEVDADGRSVTLRLVATDATRAAYPFAFVFEVRYRLHADALEATLVVENRDARPLPYYAGHHFYFALPHAARASTTLSLPTNERRAQRADGTLTEPEPGERRYALDDPRLQDRFHVLRDAGRALLDGGARGPRVAIELDGAPGAPWYAITTWSETPTSDFYCVEPWLGLPNAIAHGVGLRRLAPGAREAATCRLIDLRP